MSHHLRLAGAGPAYQFLELETIIRAQSVLMTVLEGLRDVELPDHLVGGGAIYNSVWNALTGRPPLTGIKDIDAIYFDASDLSYEAEDKVIQALAQKFADLPLPVEVRNQARVHLWFPQKFGAAFTPLTHSAEALTRYASRTHAVAVRLERDGSLRIEAPFGLDDMFSFRVTPNTALDNRAAHEKKAARSKAVWPEVTVVPWPEAEIRPVQPR